MAKKIDYYTPARKRASQKYQKEKLAQIRIWVKKGEKAVVQEEAQAQGMSMKRYIALAVNTMAGKQLIAISDDEEESEES